MGTAVFACWVWAGPTSVMSRQAIETTGRKQPGQVQTRLKSDLKSTRCRCECVSTQVEHFTSVYSVPLLD